MRLARELLKQVCMVWAGDGIMALVGGQAWINSV